MNDALATLEQIAHQQARVESLKDAFKTALIAYREADPDDVRSRLRAIHDAAVDYFSSLEQWVAPLSLLPGITSLVLLSQAESCMAGLRSYLYYWDYLERQGNLLGLPLQKDYGPPPGAELYPQMQAMVAVHYPKKAPGLRNEFAQRRLPTSGFEERKYLNEVRKMTRRANAGAPAGGAMTTLTWVAVAFGVLFLAVLLALVVFIPNPTGLQIFVFRVLLALCAGVIGGALIGGFIELKGQVAQFGVTAGGAAAFFLLVYLVNPPQLLTQSESGQPATVEHTESEVDSQ